MNADALLSEIIEVGILIFVAGLLLGGIAGFLLAERLHKR